MTKCGVPLLLAVLVVSAAADQGEPIQHWTYSTSATPLGAEWTDTEPSKLSDGDTSPGKSVILGRGTVELDITLPAVHRLTGVRAHVYRHNMNYKLEKLVVSIDRFGRWEPVGEAQGFWADTEQRAFVLTVAGLDEVTDAVRLSFVAQTIVSIQEIEILGALAGAVAAARFQVPEVPVDGAAFRKLDADGDGKPDLVLENDHLRMVFLPSHGGVCGSLLLKQPDVDLTAPPAANMGLFRDQLWEPNYSFAERFYASDHGGDARGHWIELRATGMGGMMGFTSVRKRVRLDSDSPVVRLEWELTNDPSSQTEYIYGPWFHHFTGVEGETNTYFFPTEDGVREFVLPRRGKPEPQPEEWFFTPSRGWTAVVSESGAGLAFTMEYRRLNCFYHWAGTTSTTATHEWRFNKQPVPAGESLKTEYQLTPFTGLKRVDGAVPGAVGQILTDDDPAPAGTVFLAAGEPAGEVILELREWPDGEWRIEGRRSTEPAAPGALGSLTALALDQAPPPGAYELRLRLARGEESAVVAERPCAVGDIRIAYKMTPPEPRIGLADKAAMKPGHELETSVVTPHHPWARPYAGGKLKALVLLDDRYSREVVELAQRLDIDFTYIKFYTTLDREWKYHGDRSIQTLEQAQERLAGALESEFDVIVLSGLKWDHHFTPEIRSRIEEQVASGAGLVYIEPEGFTEGDLGTWPMMGVSTGKSLGDFQAWESTADHYVTAALPWEIMPRTRRMRYDPQPSGEIIATFADGTPLIVSGQMGEGRVLTLTYDTLTHSYDYRGYSALTPILSYRGGFLLDEFKDLHYPYWELWYALLARCVVWSAGEETGCEVRELKPLADVKVDARGAAPEGQRLECVLGGDFKPLPGAIRWRIVDKYGDERLDVTEEVELAPGAGLECLLPSLIPGRSLVFVTVNDGAGGSLAWGATYVEATGPAAITDVEVASDILLPEEPDASIPRGDLAWRQWSPAEPLELSVDLDVVQPQPTDLGIRLTILDTHGRQVAGETRPVPPNMDTARISMPLSDLVNAGLQAVVELRAGDTVLDRAKRRVIAPRPHVWDRFSFTSWGGQYLWRSYYLFDFVASRVEELGLDYAFNGSNEFNTGKVWNDHWHNVGHSDLGLLSYMGKGIPDFVDRKFAEKSKAYAESGDRASLIREPCLNDPQWRANVRDAIQGRIRERMPYGGCYDYCMGDEMSLTHYTRYHDYCWSEHCLSRFREWLNYKYGGLEQLNARWESDFAAWDDVVPMTLKEAKTADNPAAWADHRAFMNDTTADFFAFVQQAIEEVHPGAKAGLSGTQSPEAGNGMDWWKMSQAFTYYHSYNTSWSNEMRRSFQGATGADQSPYYLGYWQAGRKVEYNGFWCLLHDTKGISAWTTPLFFYGDFTFSECGAGTRDLVGEMKDGIWDVIRRASRQHDGIAILYSHESVNAGALIDRSAALNASRDAWVKIIEDLGLQYEFVRPEQIADGVLSDGYRVCVLPMSIALSPAEVDALSSFVEAGGTVIADSHCGLMDDRCRRAQPGALDELFGISRREAGEAGAGVGIVTSRAIGGIPADSEIRLAVAETDIRAASAEPAAESAEPAGVPAVLRNDIGGGHAYYLNLDLTQFEEERRFHSPTEIHVRQIVADMLNTAGVERTVIVSYESRQAPHVEIVRYVDGDLEYIGLLRGYGAGDPEITSVRLPRKAMLYDVRQSRQIGEVDSLRVPMEPGEARVYCLAPEALPGPSLEADATVAAGGKLSVRASVPANANGAARVLRLRVTDPNGEPVEDYSRNLILRGGEAAFRLPLALNDPTGEWRITLSDQVTGATVEQTVRVAPAQNG